MALIGLQPARRCCALSGVLGKTVAGALLMRACALKRKLSTEAGCAATLPSASGRCSAVLPLARALVLLALLPSLLGVGLTTVAEAARCAATPCILSRRPVACRGRGHTAGSAPSPCCRCADAAAGPHPLLQPGCHSEAVPQRYPKPHTAAWPCMSGAGVVQIVCRRTKREDAVGRGGPQQEGQGRVASEFLNNSSIRANCIK